MRASLPREHGAWGILVNSLFAGILLGGWRGPVPLLLYLVLSVAGFLLERPLEELLRGRNPGSLGVALPAALVLLPALLLIFLYRRFWLLPWGGAVLAIYGIHLYQKARRQERGLFSELTGVLGLSGLGAGALYAGTGDLLGVSLGVALLLFLHFGGGVQYVRWRIRKRDEYYRPLLLYHLAVPVLVFFLGVFRVVPVLAFLAFLPALWRVLQAGSGGPKPRVKVLGWIEVGYSLVFLALLVLAYRVPAA